MVTNMNFGETIRYDKYFQKQYFQNAANWTKWAIKNVQVLAIPKNPKKSHNKINVLFCSYNSVVNYFRI